MFQRPLQIPAKMVPLQRRNIWPKFYNTIEISILFNIHIQRIKSIYVCISLKKTNKKFEIAINNHNVRKLNWTCKNYFMSAHVFDCIPTWTVWISLSFRICREYTAVPICLLHWAKWCVEPDGNVTYVLTPSTPSNLMDYSMPMFPAISLVHSNFQANPFFRKGMFFKFENY